VFLSLPENQSSNEKVCMVWPTTSYNYGKGTMVFSVLLYDPHKCQGTRLKETHTNEWKYGGSFVATKIRG
jgi:hypothetical protein